MEQQLEFPARAASEPDQRLEPDHAAGDALLQHRPARDGTPTNSRGTPGWAIWLCWNCCRLRTRATGFSEPDLPPSSRPRHRCSPARANSSLDPLFVVGYLTKQYFIGVFPQQWWSIGGQHWPARHEPDEPATHRDRSSSARAGASGTRAISWRTGTRRLRTSGRSPSGSAWVRW